MERTEWFKDAIIYQIYPRSFKDTNNDGLGDIQGIISKLDYLKDLGINCVWLSPVYDSPQDDNGYDIADYYNIWKPFGTLEDFKLMLNEMHKRGIRLLMDLVVNHTSDEHKWFKEAKKSRDNPYRDYYIWKKGKDGKAPNNWISFFGGSAWEYDKETNEYYMHIFSKKQVDLNWENPKVREEVKNILKYWLDMGVDGFRCDVINLISKDQRYLDDTGFVKGAHYFVNGPRLNEFIKDLNKDVLSKYDCMSVGETCFTTLDDAKNLASSKRDELDMIFNFDHTNSDNYMGMKWFYKKFKLKNLKRAFDKWQYGNTDGWNSLFIENHDQRRSVGRFNTSEDKYRVESAKMLATMCYFQKGTPFIYQGQELGMTNAHFTSMDEYRDTETFSTMKTMHKLHLPKFVIKKMLEAGARDNARTPMQWDDSKYAGFSEVVPWINVNPNKDYINAKEAVNNPNSIYNYFKKLIKIHKEEPLVRNGEYKDLLPKDKRIFIYTRSKDNETLLCINNFTAKEVKYSLPEEFKNKSKELLLNNYPVDNNEKEITLKPYETRLYKIK